jgi:protein-tyrosine phosphatase
MEEVEKGVVYVHCKIGYSRSAAVVGAYLLACQECRTAEEAVARLREVRPTIIIRPEAMEALHVFARRHSDVKALAFAAENDEAFTSCATRSRDL